MEIAHVVTTEDVMVLGDRDCCCNGLGPPVGVEPCSTAEGGVRDSVNITTWVWLGAALGVGPVLQLGGSRARIAVLHIVMSH